MRLFTHKELFDNPAGAIGIEMACMLADMEHDRSRWLYASHAMQLPRGFPRRVGRKGNPGYTMLLMRRRRARDLRRCGYCR